MVKHNEYLIKNTNILAIHVDVSGHVGHNSLESSGQFIFTLFD